MARRFKAQMSTMNRELELSMERMDATEFKILQEHTGKVTIMFIRKGDDGVTREYHFICDEYENVSDNYRAAQKSIKHLWSIYEDYKVRTHGTEASLENLMSGFRVLKSQETLLALPDPSTKTAWQVLGVSRDATPDEIKKAYKELSKVHHPDKGGNEAVMAQINNAKTELLEASK